MTDTREKAIDALASIMCPADTCTTPESKAWRESELMPRARAALEAVAQYLVAEGLHQALASPLPAPTPEGDAMAAELLEVNQPRATKSEGLTSAEMGDVRAATIRDLRSKLRDADDRIAKLRTGLVDVINSIGNRSFASPDVSDEFLTGAHTEVRLYGERLRAELTETKAQLDDLVPRCASLKQQRIMLEADVERLKDDVNRAGLQIADERRAHGETLDAKHAELVDVADKLRAARAEVESLREESEAATGWRSSMQADVERLTEELKQDRREHGEMRTAYEHMMAERNANYDEAQAAISRAEKAESITVEQGLTIARVAKERDEQSAIARCDNGELWSDECERERANGRRLARKIVQLEAAVESAGMRVAPDHLERPTLWCKACGRDSGYHGEKCERIAKQVEHLRDEVTRKNERARVMNDALVTIRAEWSAEKARADRAEASLQVVRAGASDVWFWQGAGDTPESLSCPVVMSADTLRDFVAALSRAEQAEGGARELYASCQGFERRLRETEAERRCSHDACEADALPSYCAKHGRETERVVEAARNLFWSPPDADGNRCGLYPSDPKKRALWDALAALDAAGGCAVRRAHVAAPGTAYQGEESVCTCPTSDT